MSDEVTPLVPVLGYVREWGGGEIHVVVDRATGHYLDGDVVVVPLETWNRMVKPVTEVDQVLDFSSLHTPRPSQPLILHVNPGQLDKATHLVGDLMGYLHPESIRGGVLIIPEPLTPTH